MINFKCRAINFTILAFSVFSVMFFAACPAPPTTNVNTTNVNVSNNANLNTNSNLSNVNMNMSNTTSSTIDTKEPDKYEAIVKLKFETSGEQKISIPAELQANVARSGANSRMSFNLPTGEKLIYLDLGGKQLLVLPQKKQYAELDKASVGFEIRSMMMPAQIVNQIKAMKGVERIGEEKYAGRDAVKYQYGSVTATKSQAGNVETKSFIFVDKETGLPLHSETTTTSMTGNYQGISGLRFLTDITDIKTDADASLFAEPTDF